MALATVPEDVSYPPQQHFILPLPLADSPLQATNLRFRLPLRTRFQVSAIFFDTESLTSLVKQSRA